MGPSQKQSLNVLKGRMWEEDVTAYSVHSQQGVLSVHNFHMVQRGSKAVLELLQALQLVCCSLQAAGCHELLGMDLLFINDFFCSPQIISDP